MALLSLDQFLYIKFPLKYQQIVTLNRCSYCACAGLKIGLAILRSFILDGVCCFFFFISQYRNHFPKYFFTCASSFWTSPEELSPLEITYVGAFIGAACVVSVANLSITNTWMLCIVRKSISRGYHRQFLNNSGLGHQCSHKKKSALFAAIIWCSLLL